MAEVKKARLFLRRSTDTDRKATTLCEGELGYSTDAFRVVVGDGATLGGLSLGTTVHVSAGALSPNFHTNLTEASAGGLAHTGDLAVFPALTYKKADGTTDSVPSASATTVMLLTGSTPNDTTSWVSINSGIPWGNLHVQTDDIKGDYISGGDISGDVTFSGTISTTTLTATSAFVRGLAGTGNRNVLVLASGQLSATTDAVTMADGTLRWINPILIKKVDGAGYYEDWSTFEFSATVPAGATTGLFQFKWDDGYGTGTHDLLMVRSSATGTDALTAVYEGDDQGNGGLSQFSCPLSSNDTTGVVAFDWRMLDATDDGGTINTAVFPAGFNFSLIGYM